MSGYITLLRGINVGGNNIVKMAELREALEQDGFVRVRTYIQSGNIVLESERDEAGVIEGVRAVLLRLLGKPIDVIVRSFSELEALMARCPYTAGTPEEGKRVMVALLQEERSPEAIEAVLRGAPASGSEASAAVEGEFVISGRDVYFRFPGSVLDSPLGERMMKLGGKTTTTRNWNTMSKLLAMSRE